jgi:hypothetical protein
MICARELRVVAAGALAGMRSINPTAVSAENFRLQGNSTTRLINYGREYRKGNCISTARVESTVDQLVDWRMEKKQHMRWTKTGAHMLLHARCALMNGELGKYTGWSPTDSSLEQAVAA